MAVWTEIVNEDVGITHVEDYKVLFPIGNTTIGEVRNVAESSMYRDMVDYIKEQTDEMRRNMEQRKQARQRLKEAGYEDVPL